jgi:hypothetical protein
MHGLTTGSKPVLGEAVTLKHVLAGGAHGADGDCGGGQGQARAQGDHPARAHARAHARHRHRYTLPHLRSPSLQPTSSLSKIRMLAPMCGASYALAQGGATQLSVA